MRTEIEDFGTGWFGLRIALSSSDVDELIGRLTHMRDHPDQHFHLSSTYDDGDGRVADVEFSMMGSSDLHNMKFG